MAYSSMPLSQPLSQHLLQCNCCHCVQATVAEQPNLYDELEQQMLQVILQLRKLKLQQQQEVEHQKGVATKTATFPQVGKQSGRLQIFSGSPVRNRARDIETVNANLLCYQKRLLMSYGEDMEDSCFGDDVNAPMAGDDFAFWEDCEDSCIEDNMNAQTESKDFLKETITPIAAKSKDIVNMSETTAKKDFGGIEEERMKKSFLIESNTPIAAKSRDTVNKSETTAKKNFGDIEGAEMKENLGRCTRCQWTACTKGEPAYHNLCRPCWRDLGRP